MVILTWNDGELLLDAVASATASIDVDVEVIVVDNGSEPPAAALLADSIGISSGAALRVLRNEDNRGVAAARNQGAAAGQAPLVCFLDSDARLHPTTLRDLVEPLRRHEEVAMAAPVFVDQAPEASAGRAPSLLRKIARGAGLTSSYRNSPIDAAAPWWDVDFAIGACQVFRRSAFEAVGGLDESYFYGPEDVDFCLRIRQAGWRVVQVRDARCDHPARRRFRNPLTRGGVRHGAAIGRHLWRQRRGRGAGERSSS